MKKGIDFAHSHGVKVYVTANIYAHNSDFDGMADYFKAVSDIGADALLVSDLGVFSLAKQTVPDMEIHVSTQANNTNYMSAKMWHSLGAKRIVSARELSLEEISFIRKNIPSEMEIETFVHGAMCISYSGRCLLSNYLTSRDANHGECSHPCRWKYYLTEETRPGEYMPVVENERGTYIYNSKDLCMIEYIPQLINAGIQSFKIEGRMKTPFYVGTVVKAYRQAIDDYISSPEKYEKNKILYLNELLKVSHRAYTTGFYFGKPTGNEQVYTSNTYIRNYDFVAIVENYDADKGIAYIEQRNKFEVGDKLELLPTKGEFKTFTVSKMWDENDVVIQSAPHPKQKIKIELPFAAEKYDIIRKPV